MKKHASGSEKTASPPPRKLTLLDLNQVYFPSADGKQTVNAEECSDLEFDTFIRHYMQIGWSLEDRRDALNFLLEQGKKVFFTSSDESPS